jgi:hypothetical protein
MVERRAFSLKVCEREWGHRERKRATYAAQLDQRIEGTEVQDEVSAGNGVTSNISKSPGSLLSNIFTLWH